MTTLTKHESHETGLSTWHDGGYIVRVTVVGGIDEYHSFPTLLSACQYVDSECRWCDVVELVNCTTHKHYLYSYSPRRWHAICE